MTMTIMTIDNEFRTLMVESKLYNQKIIEQEVFQTYSGKCREGLHIEILQVIVFSYLRNVLSLCISQDLLKKIGDGLSAYNNFSCSFTQG